MIFAQNVSAPSELMTLILLEIPKQWQFIMAFDNLIYITFGAVKEYAKYLIRKYFHVTIFSRVCSRINLIMFMQTQAALEKKRKKISARSLHIIRFLVEC
jgi:hypothetical protein